MACEIIQEAALLRGRPRLPADPVRRGSARQARAVAGRGDAGRDPDRVAGGRHDRPGPGADALYAETWSVECGFRDGTDIRFGMGMGAVHVSTPDRRDRLWLLDASAVVLLTLPGAAEEPLGYDRRLKTNTAERRTHSLLRQGHLLYELIPTMPEHRLRPLIEGFATMLVEQPVFAKAFGGA